MGNFSHIKYHILLTIFRLVMSDWTGVNSVAESIEAGCDLEMPYSGNWRGEKAIQAVKDGKLSQDAVEKSAANVLYLIDRVRGSDMSPEAPEREDDRPELRELIRRAGSQGLTLLKNENGLLPINGKTTKLGVIGPNANRSIAGGGGSASLNPYYRTLPLDSIREAATLDVSYSLGCDIFKWVPLATPFCKAQSGETGVTIEFFTGDKFEGEPTIVQTRTTTDLMLWDSAPLEVGNVWSAYVKATLTPKTTGKHTFSFFTVGPGRFYIDGKKLTDLWDWTEAGETMFDGSEDVLIEVELEAGKPYEIMAEMTNEIRPLSKQIATGRTHLSGGVRIGYKEEDKVDHLQEAITAAKEADVAIVIVGLDEEWESEGYDRKNMDLPKNGSQDRLIEAVYNANPNTIVVVQAGSPITMPWADMVPTILQGWYQGQEAGNALADVLFGKVNPSGKLPVSGKSICLVEETSNMILDNIPRQTSGQPNISHLAWRE
jgi:beta-glucosidase